MTRGDNFNIPLHIGLWGLIFLVPFFIFPNAIDKVNMSYVIWISNLSILIAFYLNYLFLVDSFFLNNKKILFFVINIILILLLTSIIEYFKPLPPEIIHFKNFPKPPSNRFIKPPIFNFRMTLPLILAVVVSIGVKINNQLRKKEVLLEKVKHSQLTSEINYLKNQVKPHFLFNTLNNIYALVNKDPETAKVSIHSLSKMMRYFLHEATQNEILLEKEITFLERYIDLMLLRVNKNFTLEKNFSEIKEPIKIPPLLLLSFIENAFKHGIDAIKPSFIHIDLSIKDNTIYYVVENSLFKNNNKSSDSGIGLENLKKRLHLIYKDDFELTEKETDNTYTAKLILNLPKK